jgi:hypothetical protein
MTSNPGILAVKTPTFLLKLATVVSSVLLGAGFVSYNAGAFDWLVEPSEQDVDAASNSTLDAKASDSSQSGKAPVETAATQSAPTIMSGTKSFTPAAMVPTPFPPGAKADPGPQKQVSPTKQRAPVLMPGPKAFTPSGFYSGLTPAVKLTPDLGVPLRPDVEQPPAGTPSKQAP